MFAYLVMGLPFIAFVLIFDWFVFRTRVVTKRDTWIIMGILMLLTLIFDQFLTGLPIVLYDESKTLGVQLGYAPIEDFLYTFVAVIGICSLLTYITKNEKSKKSGDNL